MATVKVRQSVSMYDGKGGRSTFLAHANVVDTTTLASASTGLATLATNLATISNGGISEASFSIIDLGVAAAPSGTPNVSLVGNLGYLTAGGPSRFGQAVPSFLESLISADGTIDMTAGAVATWVTYVLAQGFANNAYVAYSAPKNGFRSGRKLRR
jgi:hypothetical protein